MLDIRRNRHFSKPVEHLLEDALELEANDPVAVVLHFDDFALQRSVTEIDPCALPKLLPRVYDALPVRRRFPDE